MKGMDLAKKYYEQVVKPLLEKDYPHYLERIAVGLVGEGSECFGFDDLVSRDHDFEPGVCLWITEEDDEKIGFSLMAAYEALPKTMGGISLVESSNGANYRRGVFTVGEFYRNIIGTPSAPSHWKEWFYLPEYALATAVNGEVFFDPFGEFTAVRNQLKQGYPKDVKLKKLAGYMALMAQSGQYNYRRCLDHEESEAAQLALYEFINCAFHTIFLLHNRFTPFYKWRFRALGQLSGSFYDYLSQLTKPNSPDVIEEYIEKVCNGVVLLAKQYHFTDRNDIYLESQAIEVSKLIQDPEIRRLHLMEVGE